jgi:hypothetical protein
MFRVSFKFAQERTRCKLDLEHHVRQLDLQFIYFELAEIFSSWTLLSFTIVNTVAPSLLSCSFLSCLVKLSFNPGWHDFNTNKCNASCRVFKKPSAMDSDASQLQALALPVAGHPSSGIFVNHFALDAEASEIGLEEWIEPAMLVLNSSALLSREHQNVLDAFHLLQEDSSVQVNMSYLSGTPYGI